MTGAAALPPFGSRPRPGDRLVAVVMELDAQGLVGVLVKEALSRVRGHDHLEVLVLREQMRRYGLFQTLDRDQFCSSVDAAAATLTERDGFCSWLVMRTLRRLTRIL
jgi:hypothetical protein